MITFDEWVSKYLGKATDWDSVPEKDPVQCVDLAKIFCEECLGVKTKGKGVSAWGNARDWYESMPTKLKDVCFKIANTGTFVPMQGDICVWTMNNQYGHIAICANNNSTVSRLYTYDQNFNGKAMKLVCHNYKTFLGVLRPFRTVRKDVNIRKDKNTSSAIVGEYKKGTKVKVLDISTDGKWLKTDKGWCNNNNDNFFKKIGEK